MIANKKSKIGAEKVDLNIFINFLFVMINKKYNKNVSFTKLLLQTYMGTNSNKIFQDLDIKLIGKLPMLYNNMIKLSLLEEKTGSTHICIL